MEELCKCGHSPKDHDETYGCGAVDGVHYGAGVEDVRECQCTSYQAPARPAPAGGESEETR